jgi:hypothetical protein
MSKAKTPDYDKPVTVRIPDDLLTAMERHYEARGVAPAEQVRRGLRMYLETEGAITPTPIKRTAITRTKKK